MRRRLASGFIISLLLTAWVPSGAAVRSTVDDAIFNETQTSRTQTKRPTVSSELRKINGKLATLKTENDNLKARIAVLEANQSGLNELLPTLRSSLQTAVATKSAIDSSEMAYINQLSLILNKIRLLEGKASYLDSTNFEILSELVLLENKIISLASSFNDIMVSRQGGGAQRTASTLSDEEFRLLYAEALATYQRGEHEFAIRKYQRLLEEMPRHELADNSQYWLAECYYSMGNYRRALIEFGKVSGYPSSDKDDDAQMKIAVSYWAAGDRTRARSEFQALLDKFPDSEFAEEARQYLR